MVRRNTHKNGVWGPLCLSLTLCAAVVPGVGLAEEDKPTLMVPWHEFEPVGREEIIDEIVQRILDERGLPESRRFLWRSKIGQRTFPTADDPAMIAMIERLCQLPRETKVHVDWSVKSVEPGYEDRFAEFYFPKGYKEDITEGCEYADLVVLSEEEENSRGRRLAVNGSGSAEYIQLASYFGVDSSEEIAHKLTIYRNRAGELMSVWVSTTRPVRGFWEGFVQRLGQNNTGRVGVGFRSYDFSLDLGYRIANE